MCWFYSNQCIAFSWHRTKSVLSLTCLWRSVRIPLRVRCFISLPSMFIQFHLFTQDQRQAMDVLIYLPAKCITYWFCQKFRKLTTDCKTQKLRGHLRGLDLLGKIFRGQLATSQAPFVLLPLSSESAALSASRCNKHNGQAQHHFTKQAAGSSQVLYLVARKKLSKREASFRKPLLIDCSKLYWL